MANIPALPTGQAILTRGKAVHGVAHDYGPGGTKVTLDGKAVVLTDEQGLLAQTQPGGSYIVTIKRVNPGNIGYVNRFIADWGKVERNWRTKQYVVKSGITEALASEVEATTSIPTPATPAQPEVIAPVAVPVVEVAPPVVEPTSAPVVVATAPVVIDAPVQDLSALIPKPAPVLKVKRKVVAGQDMVILDTVHIPARFYERLERTWNRRQRGERGAVVVTGPSGTAKTLMVRRFAEAMGVPLIIQSGGKVRTADDWFGKLKQDRVTGRFDFAYNPFGAALKLGVTCIVLLDEANRAETPQALNAVLSLLDDTKMVWSPDADEYFHLPDGMLVVMTANVGAEYVGTQPMDAAVTQRFGTGIRLGYPTPLVEEDILVAVTGIDKATAKTLVAMGNHQRPLKDDLMRFPSGTGISPRMLVDIATDIVDGASHRDAVESTFEAQFSAEDAEAIGIIVDTYFPAAASATLDVDVTAINEADDI